MRVEAELSVCTDCIQVIANGCDTEDHHYAADRMLALHGDDTPNIVLGGDDLGFSTADCDGCGSPLGGDRFTASVLRP